MLRSCRLPRFTVRFVREYNDGDKIFPHPFCIEFIVELFEILGLPVAEPAPFGRNLDVDIGAFQHVERYQVSVPVDHCKRGSLFSGIRIGGGERVAFPIIEVDVRPPG